MTWSAFSTIGANFAALDTKTPPLRRVAPIGSGLFYNKLVVGHRFLLTRQPCENVVRGKEQSYALDAWRAKRQY